MYNLAIRKCTSPPLLAPRLKTFQWKFTTPPGIEPRTYWTRSRHATIWASAASQTDEYRSYNYHALSDKMAVEWSEDRYVLFSRNSETWTNSEKEDKDPWFQIRSWITTIRIDLNFDTPCINIIIEKPLSGNNKSVQFVSYSVIHHWISCPH